MGGPPKGRQTLKLRVSLISETITNGCFTIHKPSKNKLACLTKVFVRRIFKFKSYLLDVPKTRKSWVVYKEKDIAQKDLSFLTEKSKLSK